MAQTPSTSGYTPTTLSVSPPIPFGIAIKLDSILEHVSAATATLLAASSSGKFAVRVAANYPQAG